MIYNTLQWQAHLTQALTLGQKALQLFRSRCWHSLEAVNALAPFEDWAACQLACKDSHFVSVYQGVLEFLQLCNQLLREKKNYRRHIKAFLAEFEKKNAPLMERVAQRMHVYKEWSSGALSPTWALVLEKVITTRGQALVDAFAQLAQDIETMRGFFVVPQSDEAYFRVGVDLANTPGKVVFRNDLIELIYYHPITPKTWATPILMVPPWINKYYILDLTTQKSFVSWCLQQGYEVFMVSWRSADETLRAKGLEHYVEEGFLAALANVRRITRSADVHAVGYCVGGTLLAISLAFLSTLEPEKRPMTVCSATFLATQIDFLKAGILKMFTTEEKITRLEKLMHNWGGFLPGPVLTQTFNALNTHDLVWEPFLRKYFLGLDPQPFDVLYWNNDAANIPMAVHSTYLRQLYLNNAFSEGRLPLFKKVLSPSLIQAPCYFLATKKDRIVPWESVFLGFQKIGAPKTFVLGDSGHVSGVINPPSAQKYQFWITPSPTDSSSESWIKNAYPTSGSWWPHWASWLQTLSKKQKTSKKLSFQELADAPGTYVFSKWFNTNLQSTRL